MTWAMLLSTLATFGLPNVAVRETARARAANDYKTIRSLAFFTYSIAAVGSCCAAVLSVSPSLWSRALSATVRPGTARF